MARGLSHDGRTVVGYGLEPQPGGTGEQFRAWASRDGRMRHLGKLPWDGVSGHLPALFAWDASRDGSVIVGNANQWDDEGWRWTEAGGIERLTGLPPNTRAHVHAVSGEGKVIVGQLEGETTGTFRWTEEAGIELLPGGEAAWGASEDGQVIVGIVDDWQTKAGRWTPADGWVALASILRSYMSREELAALGFSATTSDILAARDVSADGRIIVAEGFHPEGGLGVWVMEVDPGLTPAP